MRNVTLAIALLLPVHWALAQAPEAPTTQPQAPATQPRQAGAVEIRQDTPEHLLRCADALAAAEDAAGMLRLIDPPYAPAMQLLMDTLVDFSREVDGLARSAGARFGAEIAADVRQMGSLTPHVTSPLEAALDDEGQVDWARVAIAPRGPDAAAVLVDDKPVNVLLHKVADKWYLNYWSAGTPQTPEQVVAEAKGIRAFYGKWGADLRRIGQAVAAGQLTEEAFEAQLLAAHPFDASQPPPQPAPSTQPDAPTTRPETPATQPEAPATQPDAPTTQPEAGSVRELLLRMHELATTNNFKRLAELAAPQQRASVETIAGVYAEMHSAHASASALVREKLGEASAGQFRRVEQKLTSPLARVLRPDGSVDWDRVQVVEDGDSARVTVGGMPLDMTLRRVEGRWYIWEEGTPQQMQEKLRQSRKIADAVLAGIKQFEQSVRDGEVSAQDVVSEYRSAVGRSVQAAMAVYDEPPPGLLDGEPTTQPDAPTTRPDAPTTQPDAPATQLEIGPTPQPDWPATRPDRPTTHPDGPTVAPDAAQKQLLESVRSAWAARDSAALLRCVTPDYREVAAATLPALFEMVKAEDSAVAVVRDKLGEAAAEKIREDREGPLGSAVKADNSINWDHVRIQQEGDRATYWAGGERGTIQRVAGQWRLSFEFEGTPEEMKDKAEWVKAMTARMSERLREFEAAVKVGKVTAENVVDKYRMATALFR